MLFHSITVYFVFGNCPTSERMVLINTTPILFQACKMCSNLYQAMDQKCFSSDFPHTLTTSHLDSKLETHQEFILGFCKQIHKADLSCVMLLCFVLLVKLALQKLTCPVQAATEPLHLKQEFCLLVPNAAVIYTHTHAVNHSGFQNREN